MTSHRTYGMDFDRNLHHAELGLSDDQVIEMYRLMLTTRRIDDRLFALQRQGRAPFVVGSSGHEAIQVASTLALDRERDWVLPYYRDMGVAFAWGFAAEEIFLGAFAKKTDPMSGGRQLPGHWSSPERRVLTQSSVIGTQYPHAVGIAQAVANRGDDAVVAVYGGEGSTSEGDWHEAMNWAGIRKLPLIFVIENNRYAISVPEEEQVAGSLAARAEAYGFPGVEVDGNRTLRV